VYGDILFASKKEIKNAPKNAGKIFQATIKGWRYALENKQEIIELIKNRYNTTLTSDVLAFESEQIEKLIQRDMFELGMLDKNRIESFFDYLKYSGIIGKNSKLDGFFIEDNKIDFPEKYRKESTSNRLLEKEKTYIASLEKELVIGVSKTNPILFQNNGTANLVAVFDLIFQTVGIKYETKFFKNREDLILAYQLGGIDLFFDYDEQKATHNIPLSSAIPYAIVTTLNNKNIYSLSELKEIKLAYLDKGAIIEEISGRYKNIHPFKIADIEKTLRDVASNPDIFMFLPLPIAKKLISENRDIKIASVFNAAEGMKLSFSHKEADETLNEIIQKSLNTNLLQIQSLLKQTIGGSENFASIEDIYSRLTESQNEYIEKKRSLKVGFIKENLEPVEFQTKNGDFNGISFDILKTITENIGLTIEPIPLNSMHEASMMLSSGKIDMTTLSFEDSKNHPSIVYTHSPYLSVPVVFIGKTEAQYIKNPKEMSGKKVAILNNHFIEHIIESKRNHEVHVIKVDSINEGLNAVSLGKVDYFVCNAMTSMLHIKQEGFTDLESKGETIFRFEPCFGFNEHNLILGEIFNSAFSLLKDSYFFEVYTKWMDIWYEPALNNKHRTTFSYVVLFISLLSILLVSYFFIKSRRATLDSLSNEKLLHSIFNIVNMGIVVVDKNAKYIRCNDTHASMTGFSEKEMLQKTIFEMLPAEYIKEAQSYFEKVIQKQIDSKDVPKEWRILKKDGRLIDVYISISLVDSESDLKIVFAIQDITDLKKEHLEKEQNQKILFHQSRLASMGEMIGNIAHQWRQPLNSLSLIMQKLDIYYEKDMLTEAIMRDSSDKTAKLIETMSSTIDDFRSFFSKSKERSVFCASDVIDSTLSIMEASLSDNRIDVRTGYFGKFFIQGYKNEFSHAILNIISNAKDVLNARKIEKKSIEIIVKSKQEGLVSIIIKDNGGGVDEKTLDLIFEPYFTTKGESGTGIGLSLTKKILANIGGNIKASVEDGWMIFEITLPQHKEELF